MLRELSHDLVLGLRARHRELRQHNHYCSEAQHAAMAGTKQEAGKFAAPLKAEEGGSETQVDDRCLNCCVSQTLQVEPTDWPASAHAISPWKPAPLCA